jgi:hypothetical protein
MNNDVLIDLLVDLFLNFFSGYRVHSMKVTVYRYFKSCFIRHGDAMVSVLAIGPKVCGFKPS